MLVCVQAIRRVWQPLTTTIEHVVWYILIAHPSEFNIGEGLGDALHHAVLHGCRCSTTDSLVTEVLRPICLGGIQNGEQVSVGVRRVAQPVGDWPMRSELHT